MSHHSQPGHQYCSTLSSPNSDSAVSSVLHTPAPTYPGMGVASGASVFSYKNYSPTASVDGESLFSRGGLTQSAMHTPGRFEESLSSASMQLDPRPLSQSMMVESARLSGRSSPTKSLRSRKSLRNRVGRFLGVFRREEEREGGEGASEEYIELFMSDASLQKRRKGGASSSVKQVFEETVREKVSRETMAVEIEGRSASRTNLSSDTEASGKSDSPVNSHRQSGLEGVGQLEALDIDISTLPPVSTRPSHSNSESSQASLHELRQESDSPNTAGAGHFDCTDAGHSYKELGASATAEITRISSSYPSSSALRVSGQAVGKGCKHTSTSETELGIHAHQLQEKLQRLVEDKEPGGSIQPSREGSIVERSIVESHTPVMEGGQSDTRTMYPPGHTLLTMRRLSVCSRRGIGLRLTSESSSGGAATITSSHGADPPAPLVLNGHPSPLALLDQFVICGEVLHRGNLDTIPLTEQEGVNWNHFGGCPHSEEFRIMQSQMVLLHSQLLFERYQCVQHAKRNRRLLSKARSAAHVTEELVSLVSERVLSLSVLLSLFCWALNVMVCILLILWCICVIQRDKLHQQEALVSSLQHQLRRVSEGQSTKQQHPAGSEGGCVTLENANLKDTNARLREELWRMQERNKKLEEVRHV